MDLIFSTAAHNKVHASLHKVIHMSFGVGKLLWGREVEKQNKHCGLIQLPVEGNRSFFWTAGFGELVGRGLWSFAFKEHHGWQKACGEDPTNGASTLRLLQGPCVCHQSRHFIRADNPTAGRCIHYVYLWCCNRVNLYCHLNIDWHWLSTDGWHAKLSTDCVNLCEHRWRVKSS